MRARIQEDVGTGRRSTETEWGLRERAGRLRRSMLRPYEIDGGASVGGGGGWFTVIGREGTGCVRGIDVRAGG